MNKLKYKFINLNIWKLKKKFKNEKDKIKKIGKVKIPLDRLISYL